MTRLNGLIAAAHTPFLADGTLAETVIDDQAKLLVESGVAGVFVGGTTGESHSLTLAERRRVTERWMAVAGGLRVVIHAGHNCRADAEALAAHAQEAGAAAVAAMAPCYFKPACVDDLIDFLAPVAAAAPALPFYYYDIPALTGVDLPTDAFLERAADRVPTLAGVKYTRDDPDLFAACLRLHDGAFDMLFGNDDKLLDALVMGARGAVGSTYNYAAPVYLRVMEAFAAGDLDRARTEQHKAVELCEALAAFSVLPAGKAVMASLGVDCGPVRSPLRSLSPAEVTSFLGSVRHLDIFARPLAYGTRQNR